MSKRTEYDPQNCPAWCTAGTDEYPCHGEHATQSVKSYIPVSGGFMWPADEQGASVPAILVGASWPEPYGEGQTVNLQIYGMPDDVQLDLKLNEALTLVASLAEMLDLITSNGVHFLFGPSQVLDAIEALEGVRDAHLRAEVKA